MRLNAKYTFQAFQKDQLWLPVALWGLFALLVGLFFKGADASSAARAFLGFLLPLISGGLASFAILRDPALELQFATPRPAWGMLVERSGIVLAVIAVTALTFQLYTAVIGIDLGLGDFWRAQLIWLIPNITAICIASLVSLLAASCTAGFAFAGTLWIVQLVLRGLFAHSATWRNVLLFFGIMAPGHPALILNQLTLLTIGAFSLWASAGLLKKQERYL